MKTKLNVTQILFTSFFVATILTFASVFEWGNKIFFGIFAFIIYLVISFISQKIFKD